jgi:hypothetical protein
LKTAWTTAAPLVSMAAHGELDEASAAVIATLARMHGIPARVEKPSALTAARLEELNLSDAALVCLSCLDLKSSARIRFAARRIKTKAPHAKLMLGLWTATDDGVLATLKDAANADHAVRTFHDAAVLILEEAIGKSLRTEGQNTATAGAAQIAAHPKLVSGQAHRRTGG